MFSNMPRLRILELKLAQPRIEIHSVFGLPPAAQLAARGRTSRSSLYLALGLTLRYTPHLVNYTAKRIFQVTPEARWQWPLISSSDMLQILRQCRLPNLRYLALEYREDEADDELLQYVTDTYPAMRCLRLFRHRRDEGEEPSGDPVVIAEHLAHQLAPLQHLARLDLQLDLPGMPKTNSSVSMTRFGPFQRVYYEDDDLAAWHRTRQEIVDRILSAQGPTLSRIKLWTPIKTTIYDWAVYEVIRDGEGVHTNMHFERPIEKTIGPFTLSRR
ncbi:hypothetical protein ONZ51_g10444 [Trametes cubensis]|uniref:Uncharacterized protein n=1 Tax=Trametes cubensis TaxID=1111947 RepID=A0AAD7TJH4_9APHY|nr:hypothetical protein ONZ51_g10444 [Trametes cubensis]